MLSFFYHYDVFSKIASVGLSYRLSNLSDIFGATITSLQTKSFFSLVSWPGT